MREPFCVESTENYHIFIQPIIPKLKKDMDGTLFELREWLQDIVINVKNTNSSRIYRVGAEIMCKVVLAMVRR
jgi:hypothetical protein